ncbi:U-box domain-containing protein 35 isoform X2 [Amaranthus tricolor]|uniref:U-box domain-containing protein 35 isoform X2 n=1 Tax=Amaranthus tricolor TaxID=29722 RepID=UPI00258A9567|nr:U-box domain-containing protein 35 isoform X2 [Amaranthus tricolor]
MEATTSSRDAHREAAATGSVSINHQDYDYNTRRANEVSEIIEIIEEEDEEILAGKSGGRKSQKLVPISENGIETNTTSLFSIDINHKVNDSTRYSSSDDVVYVAVGKSESSMDALLWALTHCVHPGSTVVYLIHIFPDLKFIPSPFGGGMVPKTSVTPDLVESYMMEDSRKRRELLNKYVDKCTSHMMQVETILIESDSVINAIVELISVLNIRRLVVGISKSNLSCLH